MAGVKVDTLTAFSSGEFTPSLAGRVDSQDYKYGVRFIENLLPETQGGVKKFYGTKRIGNIGDPDKYVMVPFNGADVPVIIVLHDDAVSIVDDDVMYDLDITVNVETYSNLKWQQSNDIIYFVQEHTAPFAIKYKGRDENTGKCIFEQETLAFKDVPYFPVSWNGNYDGPVTVNGDSGTVTVEIVTGTEGRLYLPPVLKDISGDKNIVSKTDKKASVMYKVVDYSPPRTYHYNAVLGTTNIEILRYRSGVISSITTVSVGTVKRYSSTIGAGSATVKYKTVNVSQILDAIKTVFPSAVFNQSGNYFSFTDAVPGHQAGDEYALKISQAASSSNYIYSSSVKVGNYVAKNSWPAWTDTGDSYEPIVPTTTEWGDTNIVGRKIKFIMEPNDIIYHWTAGEQNIAIGTIRYSAGSYYKAITSGTCGTTQPIHHSGVSSDGSVSWSYLHSGTATATVVSVESETRLTATLDGYLPVTTLGLSSYTFNNYQWSIWGYHEQYPSEVFFFKNRLGFFCSTDGYGCWVSMSNTDDYYNFATENYGNVLDTCAINILVTGHTDNNVNWVMSGDRLYCGSYDGEYNIYGDGNSVSPSVCLVDAITNVGGAPVRPIRLYGLNLFVGRGRDEIYTISYDYTTDDYSPENIGFMSSHLLEEKISRWDMLKNKDRNIYFTTEDKNIRIINYVKELKNLGYFRLNLKGDTTDVATSSAGSRCLTYVIVKRNGVQVIEKIMSEHPNYMLSEHRFELSSLAPVIVTDFSEQEVWVVNNETGQFYKTTVGPNGELDNRYGWLNFSVGLPMDCAIHMQPASGEKIEGVQQKTVRFIVRLKDCGSFDYGSSVDFDKKFHYNDWNIAGKQQWNSAHKLITGDIQLPSSFGYTVGQNKGTGPYPNDTGVALNIFAETPEPFTLLSISSMYV